MKAVCVLCIALVLLLPACVSASDLQTAISALPDEALIQLYTLSALEMHQRGLNPDIVVEHVTHQHYTSHDSTTTPIPESSDASILNVIQQARDAWYSVPYTETFTTYDPPPTPIPTPRHTFAPLLQLEDTDTVWISDSGDRYHTTPDCSGMRSPSAVTLQAARDMNRTACRDCAYWLAKMEE